MFALDRHGARNRVRPVAAPLQRLHLLGFRAAKA